MQALRRFFGRTVRLQNLGIELRLQMAFVCVLLLIFVGGATAFWHFQRVRDRVAQVAVAERRLTAVLRINNNLVTLTSRLHRAADSRDAKYFSAQARRLLALFRSNTTDAISIIHEIGPATGREQIIVDSVGAMVEGLPDRISTLIELSQAGDWSALHARLADQVDHTDDVAEALMADAETSLSEARNRLFEDINHTEHQAAEALVISGLLGLLVAAALGLIVTQSITGPLASLNAGASALATGDFAHRVEVQGSNELANLAAAFNRTAAELADLYGQLRHSEARFRSLIENASDLILVVGITGKLSYVSPAAIRLLGYSPDVLLGRPIRELVIPEEASRADQIFTGKTLSSGGAQPFELPFRHRDGSLRLLNGVVTNLAGNPAVGGVLVNARDVSASKQAEQALRRSEERLQELLIGERQARNTAELLNQVGHVLSAELDEGRLTQSLTDIATRLVGAQFGVFFYEGGCTHDQCNALFSGITKDEAEHFLLLRNTTLWPTFGQERIIRVADISTHEAYAASAGLSGRPALRSYLASPVSSRSRRIFGVLLFGHSSPDVFSERDAEIVKGICAQAAIALENARLFEEAKVTNRALQNSNQALRQANDDLSVFAYSASHDLQEPLRNVSLYSQMLQRKYKGRLDAEADEFIGYLIEGSARMSDLVKDLLSYMQVSGSSAGPDRSTSVEAAIENVISNLKAIVRRSKATIVCDDLPNVPVEAVHLQQLFQNLISNAIKYRSIDFPHIRISAAADGEYWYFSVKDNGIGINPKYSQTVFRPFKRLHGHHEYPGTGIGLAICQKIVERYGGRIWVESQPGKGSDFKFTLPQANPETQIMKTT